MPTVSLTPEQRIRQRYTWFQEAARVGKVTLACRQVGWRHLHTGKWAGLVTAWTKSGVRNTLPMPFLAGGKEAIAWIRAQLSP